MHIIQRGDKIKVIQGAFAGRRGHVIGLIGHAESLVVEVQLMGEPSTTCHRVSQLQRDLEPR